MRAILLLGVLLFPQALIAVEASERTFQVERDASFGNFDTPLRRLTVSLGELPADQHVNAVIRLINVTQTPIEFLTLRKSCNCLEAKVVNSDVAPQKSADIFITLHTRLRSFHPDQVTTFQVETKQDGKIDRSTISIEYTLKGIVAFPSPAFHHQIPIGAKEAEVRIPLLVTAPVRAGELEVETELNELPQLLRDEESDDRWWVVFRVDPKLLQKDMSLFKVRVSDPNTGRAADALVTLERTAAFRVSPRTMRFRKAPEGGGLVASSIIHIGDLHDDRPGSNDQGTSDDNDVIVATATVDGMPLQVKIESLGAKVFRVETRLREDQLPLEESSELIVHWDLMYRTSKANVRSLFVVEDL